MSVQVNDQNLGHATAYGYASSKGYTGTEDEFAELMASYADVAEQAAESAEQAAASATTASTKASEAAQSATAAASSKTAAQTAQTGAETAATTATTKAGEASASATTASGKATEATTAAGTATTKASEATTAATTATTKAGEASTSATNAAASATRAQEILDSIPADYSQLSDDVEDLKDGLQDIETALDHKAEIDGYYQDMTVGNAEQLVTSVGIDESVPYNFRTSGGSAEIGDRLTDKVVGGTIAWNQQLKNGNFANGTTNWTGSSAILTVTDGVARCTLDGDAWNNDMKQNNATVIDGHIYLIGALVRQSSTDFSIMFRNPGGQNTSYYFRGTEWTRYASLIKVTSSSPNGFALTVRENGTTLTDEWFEAQNINCFDLTQMFGSAIADYIYSLERSTAGAGVAWFKKLFPKDYYEYNAGELMSVQASSHDTVGFNAFDKNAITENTWFANEQGDTATANGYHLSDYIPIIPDAVYYRNLAGSSRSLFFDADKNVIDIGTWAVGNGNGTFKSSDYIRTSQNAYYIRFTVKTEYLDTFCINLSWDGERNGEYEPYVKHTYPLDNDLVLRGIPKLDANNSLYYDGDTYESDGTVTRRYGVVTFDGSNDESWSSQSSGSNLYYTPLNITKSDNYLDKIVCDKLTTMSRHTLLNTMTYVVSAYIDSQGSCPNQNWLYIKADDSITSTAMMRTWLASNPITVVYELATPTTETADPYQNPQIVDDFGTEEYVDAGSRDVAIPVGHETFYAANLKAKLEMSPDSPSDGDGDYIVRQTNGINEYVKMVKELPTMPTSNGSYHLKVTVTSGTPTLTWEADT